MSSRARPAAVAATAAALGWGGAQLLRRRPAGARWERTNHRGTPLTLLEGPALALGSLAGVAVAPLPPRARAGAALVTGAAAALGAVDDLVGSADAKGLRGHLGALARGRLTTGGLKVLGIGAASLAGAALVDGPRRGAASPAPARAADRLVAGALVAGTANLVNLLDLRPGRALKAVLLLGHLVGGAGVPGSRPAGPLAAAGAGSAAVLLLPDLRERGMLGDCGANAAGALLGAALLTRTRSRTARGGVLAAVLALTAASERVSFTRVIEGTPVLAALDRLGRRPPAPPSAGRVGPSVQRPAGP
ncbi:hypothetical protein WDZ17_14515 [Pseudokineococcus basanitobsidens]|uniref:UDP-N-acetylmuramyl pentapeptide phosphotransferase/UDP-N-acetylglucosamine-1-phosphate transferase n=1 Tax=Pseudokineococcus basanitobsidens TaxID=1926649 RepID=A0ABU8RN28_9ACTN